MSSLLHKTKFIPFINVAAAGSAASWKQIKKSTTFSLAFNPQTKTYDFISSENPEEEIDSYQPALSQSLTMFSGEDDYDAIFDMCFNLPTAGSAHRDMLIVFYAEKYTTAETTPVTYYKAWKADSVIKLGTLDSVGSTIDFDVALNKKITGAVTIVEDVSTGVKTPTWVAGTWSSGTFTPAT